MRDFDPELESLKVLVLEDEWIARNFLVEIIESSGVATVIGAVGAFDDAVELIDDRTGLDAVFVDINLVGSDHSGLDLVRQFAGKPGAPAFVLATATKDHALEAFQLGVVDYVLKPFDKDRIHECLHRLRTGRRIAEPPERSRPPTRIVARRKRSLVFLLLPEVWAFEAAEGLTLVHSERGVFDVDLSLDAVASSFGRHFTRVHRNWLVNEEHVLELDREAGETTLLVGSRTPGASPLRVPVARDRAAVLRSRLVNEGIGIRRR